jgi:hypothetical protein
LRPSHYATIDLRSDFWLEARVICTRIVCDKPALPGSAFCAEHQQLHQPVQGGRRPPPPGRAKDAGYGLSAPIEQPSLPIETPDQLARRLQKLAPRKAKRKRK